jgi:hypothetical protein
MNPRFLHIYVKPNDGVTSAQVEEKLNKALDWYRYDANLFIVYSSSDLSMWKTRLKPVAGGSGYYFVCEIDVSKRVGWMPKSLWEWLRKDR